MIEVDGGTQQGSRLSFLDKNKKERKLRGVFESH
jgi:hypothetical protein